MKKTQRWLCLLLVFCMMLSVLPVTAMAAEPGTQAAGAAEPRHGEAIYEDDFSGNGKSNWPVKGDYTWTGSGTLQGKKYDNGSILRAEKVTGLINAENYVVSAKVKLPLHEDSNRYTGGYSAGIVFHAQDNYNYYHLRVERSKGGGDIFQLWQWKRDMGSNGQPVGTQKTEKLMSCQIDWNVNVAHTLAAVVIGNTIYAYYDGEAQFSYEVADENAIKAGTVGFRIHSCDAEFDDLKVWKLPEARVEITAPVQDAMISNGNVTIRGKVIGANNAKIAFDSGSSSLPVTLEADGSFSYETVLSNGTHTVTVAAVDPNGTSVTASRSFTVNVQEPEAVLDPSGDGEETLTLNGDWYFKTDPTNTGIAGQWFNEDDYNDWDVLPVPGNWDLENEYANYKGVAWYARSFTVDEKYRNYPVYLNMVAAYRNCTIWINGQEAGTHADGHTTFELRIDQFLRYGDEENTITVKLDNNSYDRGAWWKWGGISGGASLKIRNTAKLDWQHIVSTPDLAAKTAELNITYRMDNASNAEKQYTLVTEVIDQQTNSTVGTVRTSITLAAMQNDQTVSAQLHLDNVKLWYLDDPNLYTVKTWLKDGAQTIHYVEDDIGIRKIEINDCKFYLNGEHLRLTGANRVWDDRVNGQTEPDYLVMRDIDYMKSMGMNCARMSHVPMTKNILDYCDQVGFLLICEGNCWGDEPQKIGDSYECVPRYTEMIEQDYNHPSIFAWSIGNEMHGTRAATKAYAQFMVPYIKSLDSTRFVTEVSNTAGGSSKPDDDSVQYADFICRNAYGGFKSIAEKVHKFYPGKAIFFTETGYSQNKENLDSTINAQGIINDLAGLEYVAGASLWTLNDYRSGFIGTPAGQNRAWGVTTVWGDKKAGFEKLRSAFSPVKSLTVMVNGDTQQAGEAMAMLQLEMKNIEETLPAYPLRNANLKWEAIRADGTTASSGLCEIPEIPATGGTYSAAAQITVPEGGIAAVRATVVDSLGYEIAETMKYLQAPATAPVITGVITTQSSARVTFEGVDMATSYVVTASNGGTPKTVTVKSDRYANFAGLTGTGWQFTVAAVNEAGTGAVSVPVAAELDSTVTALPPVIWHTEPIANGFFVGYSAQNDTDTYEIHYGLSPEQMDQTLSLQTSGGAKVSGLIAGRTYYYRIRNTTTSSAWSQTVAVIPEAVGQALAVPNVKGAAAGKDRVSLTIDPVWKATGYRVAYGTAPNALTNVVEIKRSEVEQLMISGLQENQTYYFAVASLNGTAASGYSSVCAATTADSTGLQNELIVNVETKTLRLTDADAGTSIGLSAFTSSNGTISVKAEELPQGMTAEEQIYSLQEGINRLDFQLSCDGSLAAGRYSIVIVVSDVNRKALKRANVTIEVLETKPLLQDDYSEVISDRYTEEGNGTHAVQDDKLNISANAANASYLMITGEADWTDYIVSATMYMQERIPSTSAGLVFRYVDKDNFWHLRIDEQTETGLSLQVLEWAAGKATKRLVIPIQATANGMYQLKVQVVGNTATVFLDGKVMGEVAVSQPKGKVGYRVYGRSASFDDFIVRQIIAAPAVDKFALTTAIDEAKKLTETNYTADSWKTFADELKAAEEISNKDDATQKEVDAAVKALTDAKDALVKAEQPQTVDKSELQRRYNDLENLPNHGYTQESWNSFENALKHARDVLNNSDATQDDVDYALIALNKAANDLTQITPPTPVIPVTPSEPAQNPFNPNAGSNTNKFPFLDVPSDSWYYSSVKAAWENDLIDGVTANEFKPNATLTVAQTIKLAAALHQLDRTGKVSLTNGGANWYDSYVNYAVTNGIIEKDYANYSKAQMNAPVTRGEFVHIFHGAEEAYKAINTVADNAIPDVKTTDKFAPEIYEFYRAGILTGSDAKGTFHSASTIKRSEAAAILLRMFETSARKSITLK